MAFFRKGLDPTSKLVSQLVAAEACYVNTAHPDFVNGHRALAIVYDKLQLHKPSNTPSASASADGKLEKYDPKKTTLPPSANPQPVYNLDGANETGIFASFFSGSKKTNRKPGVLEPPPAVLKASGAVSEREFTEIEVISKNFIINLAIIH